MILVDTSLGTVKIELWHDKTPATAENFVNYAQEGHYNGTIFHRAIPNFMIQGGGFDAKMTQKPSGKPIRNESAGELKNLRGTLAMARTADPHSATSQFFINLKDNDFLDRDNAQDGWGYAVFGKVVEGMDVVDRIAARPTHKVGPHGDVPVEPIVITSVRVEKAAG